jgi:hypothetical protein
MPFQSLQLKPNTKNQNVAIFAGLSGATQSDVVGVASLDNTDVDKISYFREGASADVAVTVAAGTLGSHTAGGFKEIDGTNAPGLYQFGLTDAALEHGAKWVDYTIQFSSNQASTVHLHIDLVRSVAW